MALATVFALFLGLPVLAILTRALLGGLLPAAAASSTVLPALALSLATTAVSLVITVAFGLPLALVLARRRFRGKWLVETVVDLPIVLPPSVAGLALLLVFGRRGLAWAGPSTSAGIDIAFTALAVILAQVFVSAPFFVRSARAGIAAVDRDLEDAARVDGASEPQLFRRVTVPLAGGALAAGLVMSWARAMGEFGATIMFAGNVAGRTQTHAAGRLLRVRGREPRDLDRGGRDPRAGGARRPGGGSRPALGPGSGLEGDRLRVGPLGPVRRALALAP